MNAVSAVRMRTRAVDAEVLAYGGLTCAAIGWAAAYVAGKVVLAQMTPLAVAAWRFAVAALVLLPFAIRSRPGRDARPAAASLAVLVVCGGVLYPWLFLVALSRTSATNAALLIALNPIFTLLLAPLIGEPLNRHRLGGVLVALLGAATVITRGHPGTLTSLAFNSGDLLALAAAALWSVFNLASRGAMARLTPAFTNCVVCGVGSVALFALAASQHPWAQLRAAGAVAWSGLAVMAIVSTVVSGQLFLLGVRTLGVSRTVVFIYLMPVLTAVLATTLLGEQFYAAQAVGGAAVLAGVYWSTRVPAAGRVSPPRPPSRRRARCAARAARRPVRENSGPG